MNAAGDSRPLAVVTGASAGIGAVFARRLAARGYDLLLVARRADRLQQLAAELQRAHGVHAGALAADLASDAGLHAVEQRLASAANLELLVNNAGFGTMGRFFRADVHGQDQMHRLHVLATVRLCHAALVNLTARNRGGIINVSSVAAFLQSPGSVSYCATKTWMNVFTDGLYQELRSLNSAVKVQALCPGYTYSEFHDVAGFDRSKVPSAMWLSAESVVEEALRAWDRGVLYCVPGWRYKLIVALLRLLPAAVLRAVAVRTARRLGR
jgi:short-subunit dehydrogenase